MGIKRSSTGLGGRLDRRHEGDDLLTSDPDYREDPTDREVARVVGAWAKDKQHYVGRYMTIFANGMHHRWDALAYVDLFAGPGSCVVEETEDFYGGAAIEAMARPFSHFIFLDLDTRATEALGRRAAPLAQGRPVTIINRDCNEAIDEVIARIPPRALTLAFIDPTNWQITFESVRKLVTERSIDVILTFHDGLMKRVGHIEEQPRVDAFFGTDAWRPLVASGRKPHLYDFCQCYRNQMKTLGFEDHAAPIDPSMRNSTDVPLYHLLFFSRNEKGHDFWDQVVQVGPTGQMTLLRQDPAPRRR